MKHAFFILTLALGFTICNGKTEKPDDNAVLISPKQFKLTDTNATINPGDFYMSTRINYEFSGIGDENWMDETPYLTKSCKLTLDSVAGFLNKKPLRIRIYFVTKDLRTFDSCVECAFEKNIRDYLIASGVKEDRVVCSNDFRNSKDLEENLNKIRNAQPGINSLYEYVLLVNEPL